VSVEDTDVERRRRKRRKKKNAVESSTSTDDEEKSDAANNSHEASSEDILKPQPVLMIEVENVTHEKFMQTEEVKVKIEMTISNCRFTAVCMTCIYTIFFSYCYQQHSG
jgi:hypothetical protein